MAINKIFSLLKVESRRSLYIVVSLFLISAIVLLIKAYAPLQFESITREVNDHVGIFYVVRGGIILFIVLCWPYFVLKIGHSCDAKPEQISKWKNQSWRMMAWLIIVELLVCENIIGKAIHLLTGL